MESLLFNCNICNKGFDKKYNLNRHIELNSCCTEENTKSNIVSVLMNKEDKYTCEHCDNIYERYDSLKYHLENKKSKCYKTRNPDPNIIQQKQYIKNKKIIYKTINKNNITHNHNNNYNTVNSNINNINNNNIAIQPVITIAKHGEETISHITEEIMLQLLAMETFTQMSTELTKLLYFNDKVPENKNWTIVYPRNKKGGLQLNHDTNEFEREATEKIINFKFCNMITLFLPMVDNIDKRADELNLTWRQRSNIKKFTSYFGTTQISKEAKYIYDSIKEMVYNERIKTMKTWKEKGYEGNHLSLKF